MILLADRNFGAKDIVADIAATGADVLVRVKNGRKLAVLRRLPDGSYLSTLGTLRVRVVYCEITIATTNCCAPPSRTRPAPQPAPIRTVPASASPGRPRGISSSKPRT